MTCNYRADTYPCVNDRSIFKKHDTLFEAISWVVQKEVTATPLEPLTAEPPVAVDSDSDAEQLAQLAQSLSLDTQGIHGTSPTSISQSKQLRIPRVMPTDSSLDNLSHAQLAPSRFPAGATSDGIGASRNNLLEPSTSEVPHCTPPSTSSQEIATTTSRLYPPLPAEDLLMLSKRQVNRGALVSRGALVFLSRPRSFLLTNTHRSNCLLHPHNGRKN